MFPSSVSASRSYHRREWLTMFANEKLVMSNTSDYINQLASLVVLVHLRLTPVSAGGSSNNLVVSKTKTVNRSILLSV